MCVYHQQSELLLILLTTRSREAVRHAWVEKGSDVLR